MGMHLAHKIKILKIKLKIFFLRPVLAPSNLPFFSMSFAVNDRKCVFHFRPKPNIWPEKHLALGRIPKPKPNVQI